MEIPTRPSPPGGGDGLRTSVAELERPPRSTASAKRGLCCPSPEGAGGCRDPPWGAPGPTAPSASGGAPPADAFAESLASVPFPPRAGLSLSSGLPNCLPASTRPSLSSFPGDPSADSAPGASVAPASPPLVSASFRLQPPPDFSSSFRASSSSARRHISPAASLSAESSPALRQGGDVVLESSRAAADRLASTRRGAAPVSCGLSPPLPGLFLRMGSFLVAFLAVFAVHLHIASLSLLVRHPVAPEPPEPVETPAASTAGILQEARGTGQDFALQDGLHAVPRAYALEGVASSSVFALLHAQESEAARKGPPPPAEEKPPFAFAFSGLGKSEKPRKTGAESPLSHTLSGGKTAPSLDSALPGFLSFSSSLFPPSLLTAPSPLPSSWPFAEDILIAWHLFCQALGCLVYGAAADSKGRQWALARALKVFTFASVSFTVCALVTAGLFRGDAPPRSSAVATPAHEALPLLASQLLASSAVEPHSSNAHEEPASQLIRREVLGSHRKIRRRLGSSDGEERNAPKPQEGEAADRAPKGRREQSKSPELPSRIQNEGSDRSGGEAAYGPSRLWAPQPSSESVAASEMPMTGDSGGDAVSLGVLTSGSSGAPVPRAGSSVLSSSLVPAAALVGASSKVVQEQPVADAFSWETPTAFFRSVWRAGVLFFEQLGDFFRAVSRSSSRGADSLALLPSLVFPFLALLFFSMAAAACGGIVVAAHCMCFEAAAAYRLVLDSAAPQVEGPSAVSSASGSGSLPASAPSLGSDDSAAGTPSGELQALRAPLLPDLASEAPRGRYEHFSVAAACRLLGSEVASVCICACHWLAQGASSCFRGLRPWFPSATPRAISRFAFASSPYIPIAYLVAAEMVAHFFLPAVLSASLSKSAAGGGPRLAAAPFPVFCLAASFSFPLCLLLLLVSEWLLVENPYFLAQQRYLQSAMHGSQSRRNKESPRGDLSRVHPAPSDVEDDSAPSAASSLVVDLRPTSPATYENLASPPTASSPSRVESLLDSCSGVALSASGSLPGGESHSPPSLAAAGAEPEAREPASESYGRAEGAAAGPSGRRGLRAPPSDLLAPLLPSPAAGEGRRRASAPPADEVSPRASLPPRPNWCLPCLGSACVPCSYLCFRRANAERGGWCSRLPVVAAARASLQMYRRYLAARHGTALSGITAPAACVGAAFYLRGFFRFLLLDCVVLEEGHQGVSEAVKGYDAFGFAQRQAASQSSAGSGGSSLFQLLVPVAQAAPPAAPGHLQAALAPGLHLFRLETPVMLVRVLTAILPVFLLSLLPPKPLQMVGSIVCGFMSFGIALTLTTLSQRFPSIPPISASRTASLLYEVVFCWCSFAPAFTVALLPLQGFHTGVRGGAAAAAAACVRAGAGLSILLVQLLFNLPVSRSFADMFSGEDSPGPQPSSSGGGLGETAPPPPSLARGDVASSSSATAWHTTSDDTCSAEAIAAAMFSCAFYVVAAALTLMVTTHVRLPKFFGEQLIEERQDKQAELDARAARRLQTRRQAERPELRRLVSQRWGAQWVEGEEEGVGVLLDRLYLHLINQPAGDVGADLEEEDDEELADEGRTKPTNETSSQSNNRRKGRRDAESATSGASQVLRSRRAGCSPG
ncbi:hypothetical protein BESB_047640 [Besnoitia besnoiti]|uniref:Transmembrane protein n=1 Tax=Besnoitia besnoiti TaxID=94643 RepID=A0A2A9MM43_BESBE|nr:hypothetical protein BESB_047640 [Besnoitia besnoiti]PFH36572.1 hypothetical protein BESB_047640 [Besnoitia besnoiti]